MEASMEIRFHRRLYPKQAVQEAAAVFEDSAAIAVSRDGDYWTARIEPTGSETDPEELSGEFENYVLGLTISKRGTP